jgi:hypothetical protein
MSGNRRTLKIEQRDKHGRVKKVTTVRQKETRKGDYKDVGVRERRIPWLFR